MCGIAGVMELDRDSRVEPHIVNAMCATLRRRGPDDYGCFVNGHVGLGMRRLSIIDVDGGRQPIANEDGTLTIVFNGEIFNYRPLQAALKQRGHRFKTRSDTETILHLFEEEGPGCLRHLRGMFAIAIWNARDRSLFVARDRLGIKPLHYAFDGRRFVFGSEIKALVQHPDVKPTIDWTAVDTFFTYGFIPAPWTIYNEIRKLRPGYYMTVDARGARETQYWDLPFAPKLRESSGDIASEFLTRFRESVEMRMESEVPLGAFLSGGIDSSLVVATMAEASGRAVNTFTIGFGGDTGSFLDERPFARAVSARYGTDHREFTVEPDVDEAIEVALDAFDEPFADDSLVPTHHVCQMARQHVTVVLTGLGGDENFAGYERHLGFALSDVAARSPWRQMLSIAGPVVAAIPEPRGGHYRLNHLKRFMSANSHPPAQRWQRYLAAAGADDRRGWYRPEIARLIDFDAVDDIGRVHFERAAEAGAEPLDCALYQDLKFYLPDDILALSDRVGMWHSLELRVPFVDHTLVEFCARIPTVCKVKWGEKKRLLRSVARPLLPASVIEHRKQGFSAPMATWLRGSMRKQVEEVLAPKAIAQSGVLDPIAVRQQMIAHQDRRALNDKRIFSALMFERWWRRRAQ